MKKCMRTWIVAGPIATLTTATGITITIDSEDVPRLSLYRVTVCSQRGGRKTAYINCRSFGKRRQYILARFLVTAPPDTIVDHIDHDTLNNKKVNLRVCTYSGNSRNRTAYPLPGQRSRGVGYKGVAKCRSPHNPWQAQIHAGKHRYLGCFKTQEEAAKAYDIAAVKYFGEFACLNFPEAAAGIRETLASTAMLGDYTRQPPTRPRTTSGFVGVCCVKKSSGRVSWTARIAANGKSTWLGTFKTGEDAARTYDEAAHRLHGSRAVLNFPP